MNWLGFTLVPALLVGPICSVREGVRTTHAAPTAESRKQDRKQYQDKINTQLRELDREIDALKTKAAQQGKEAKRELDQRLPELDKKRAVAQQKFEELQNSSQEAWQDMRVGLSVAMRDLEAAYKRAASRFD